MRGWILGCLIGLMILLPARLTAASDPCPEIDASLRELGRPRPEAQRLLTTLSGPVAPPVAGSPYVVRRGDTLAAIARRHGTTVDAIARLNGIRNVNMIYVGQRLRLPDTGAASPAVRAAPMAGQLDPIWLDRSVVQGEAALLWLRAAPGSRIHGSIDGQAIAFHERCGLYWGLVAFDALLDEPGTYHLSIDAVAPDGTATHATVAIPLAGARYPVSPVLRYPSDRQALLDRELITAENAYVNGVIDSQPARDALWSGRFWLPLDSYVTNVFGHMGSIDGGPPVGYHEGIDYRGRVGTPVQVPAGGVVILSEWLNVRGNTIFIDHGAGVVSGYFHLSERGLSVGDVVASGQYLGRVGSTGLVTGPHLHWELRVNNRWVNPNPFTWRAIP